MVRFCKHILLALCLFPFFSCQEGREAGDLLGQWHLNGSDTQYISFSGSVVLFRDLEKGTEKGMVFGKFQHVSDSLFIQCVSIKGLASDTAVVEESFGFKPFKDIRLKVEKLNDDHLILSRENQTWSCRKY